MLKREWRNKYKYNSGWRNSIILFSCLSILSCNQQSHERNVNRAFYYWKSTFRLSANELKLLDTLKVKTLYVKYFDVDWDNERLAAIPKATLRVQDKVPADLEIIPCIFITNACIGSIDSTGIPLISANIISLLKKINAEMGQLENPEIQIDCDWTAGTKDRYFMLLNMLRKDLQKLSSTKTAKLSCTIRLHQIKYLYRTGVPPVDRGMLMAYNMGNLKNPATKNSILENEELKKYIGNLSTYPLHLDVAMPVFNWIVLYRKNEYTGLIQHYAENMLHNQVFHSTSFNRFKVLKDTIIEGYEFREADILRVEQSDYSEIIAAMKSIRKRLPAPEIRLTMYHFDSLTLSKYTVHEMETIFSGLN
ncbi:MAG: hypothetical protein ABIQ56_02405 [Chitinophagaceae bacterium]